MSHLEETSVMFTLKGGGGSRPRDRRRQSGAEHFLFIYVFIYLFMYKDKFWGKKRERGKERFYPSPPFDQTLTKLLPILFSGLELLASIFRLLSKCVENNHTKETFSSHTFHIQLTFSMASLEAIFLASGRLKNNEL